MSYKIDGTNRGRPTTGIEEKTIVRNLRIEPYLDARLTCVCKMLKISRSEAMRQGIILFLQETENQIESRYY